MQESINERTVTELVNEALIFLSKMIWLHENIDLMLYPNLIKIVSQQHECTNATM